MEPSTILAWIGIFGIVTGFRALLPMAVLCYYGWRAQLPLPGHWTIFGQLWVMLIFFVLAAGELAADKWKGMPNRTAPPGLLARVVMGGIAGAALASSTLLAWWNGAGVCALLAIFGAALGYSLRQYFREATRAPDFYIAVAEDALTLIGAYWVLEHLA